MFVRKNVFTGTFKDSSSFSRKHANNRVNNFGRQGCEVDKE